MAYAPIKAYCVGDLPITSNGPGPAKLAIMRHLDIVFAHGLHWTIASGLLIGNDFFVP
jgi:hypothetical protein